MLEPLGNVVKGDASVLVGSAFSLCDLDDFGPVLTVLDWIWSECNVHNGKGFTDSVVSPLAGNYNSISANGEAWKSVGTNFGLLASDLLSNGTTLTSVTPWPSSGNRSSNPSTAAS